MTKIYEALENAGRARAVQPGAPARSTVPKALESILLSLYQRIDASIESPDAKLVGFTNAEPGHDSAKLLCAFAKLAALRLNKRVLVVAPGPASQVTRVFATTGTQGWEGVVTGEVPASAVIHPAGESLAVTQLTVSETALPAVLAAPGFKQQLSRVRGDYDLILFDTPPLAHAADLAMLSSALHGVVIVAEAGKTRRQAARYGAEQVTAQGGRVLGVVLNRRRYYIPSFLYQRL